MTCLRDFLEWYNNQDVRLFVQAVRKLQAFYFERNINIFKVAMSVKTSNVSGPSIIFNPYAKTRDLHSEQPRKTVPEHYWIRRERTLSVGSGPTYADWTIHPTAR